MARVHTYPKALELATGIAASVKGHPKYGANGSVYAAMAYTTKGTSLPNDSTTRIAGIHRGNRMAET